MLQLHIKKKKVTTAVVTFFVELHSRKKKAKLSSPSSWSCAATKLHSRKKKVTVVVVAFFVELHCSCTARGRR
jgi:hypothetical protein